MTYSESPFSQLSDELWHVFGGRRRFPTTRERLIGVSFFTALDVFYIYEYFHKSLALPDSLFLAFF